jgi:hypothetical protein
MRDLDGARAARSRHTHEGVEMVKWVVLDGTQTLVVEAALVRGAPPAWVQALEAVMPRRAR